MNTIENLKQRRLSILEQIKASERLAERAAGFIPAQEQKVQEIKADKDRQEREPVRWSSELKASEHSLARMKERVADFERLKADLSECEKMISSPPPLPHLLQAWNVASEMHRAALLRELGISSYSGKLLSIQIGQ